MRPKKQPEKLRVARAEKNISPCGGLLPVLKKIEECNLPQVIRKCLGKRKAQSTYGYEDVFIAWVLTSLRGGMRLDHITKFRKDFKFISGLKLPSHDTLGRVMKKLSTENSTSRTVSRNAKAKISYTSYNDNVQLNRMLIKATKAMGWLQQGPLYTLDIDATFIETECLESNFSYDDLDANLEVNNNVKRGFYPMVCLIGDCPVYISMRGALSSPEFQIKECLEQCLNILAENGIRIGKVVSDAAGYNKALMDMLDERGIKYNIHGRFSTNYKTMIKQIESYDKWDKVELKTINNCIQCEVADIPYLMTGADTPRRLIVARVPTRETRLLLESPEEKERRERMEKKMEQLERKKLLKQKSQSYLLGEWKEHNGYLYKLIISNDYKKTPQELLLEYNKRGNSENKFKFMKEDFGWRLPPFMKMNQNTVFMIAAALANNVFRSVVKSFKKKIPQLRLNARLLDFQLTFISVVCEFIVDTYYFYNTDIEYEKIM